MHLQVYFHNQHCGQLVVDNQQRMSFNYLPEYIQQNGPALSVNLPVGREAFADKQIFPFFENLLPEGAIRQRLASRLGTADNNFSRLLDETGGDVEHQPISSNHLHRGSQGWWRMNTFACVAHQLQD